MTDWVALKHDVTGGTTRVPNDKDVLEDFAFRGWHPDPEPPFTGVFVPAPDGQGGRTDLDPANYSAANPDDTSDEKPATRKPGKKE